MSLIFPEIAGQRDDVPAGRWVLRVGGTARGTASCDIGNRILEVPLGPGNLDRVVRLHELMHLRLSPLVTPSVEFPKDVAPRALECAEELRVNHVLNLLGMDTELLCDGSEKSGGERLVAGGHWNEAVCFLAAVMGTGGEKSYLSGVAKANREWAAALRVVRKRLHAIRDSLKLDTITGTTLRESGLNEGYETFTIPIARVLTRAMSARVPHDALERRQFARSLEPGGRRPPTGRFADLKWAGDEPDWLSRRFASVPKWRPYATGTSMRYPSRLLTDPHRRAFGRRARGRGGVVVIDQSGSMDLSVDDLERVLRVSPDATILGYSHRPGDIGSTPNVWTIALPGSRSVVTREGNVGNGVDGPVLEWAARWRRPGEPLVWVTDGQITDSHDHPDPRLAQECARLVRRHGVRMVRSVAEVGPSLRNGRLADQEKFGRVGQKLREI